MHAFTLTVLTVLAAPPANPPSTTIPAPPAGTWTLESLDGCEGNLDRWELKDGILVGRATAERPLERNAYVWLPGKHADFVLTCRFRITGGNSGIQYRTDPQETGEPKGFQADIDAANSYTGRLYEGGDGGRGLVNERGERVAFAADGSRETTRFLEAAKADASIKTGEWNDYRIEAVGGTVRHLINGTLVTEVFEAAPRRRTGRIGMQLHTGEPMTVEFAEVALRPVGASAPKVVK
jgi:hypothetical protein